MLSERHVIFDVGAAWIRLSLIAVPLRICVYSLDWISPFLPASLKLNRRFRRRLCRNWENSRSRGSHSGNVLESGQWGLAKCRLVRLAEALQLGETEAAQFLRRLRCEDWRRAGRGALPPTDAVAHTEWR